MQLELKDKIIISEELLTELERKGWAEVEQLQAQLANLSENPVNNKLSQLLNNLITSYYIFLGGIEALNSNPEDKDTTDVVSSQQATKEVLKDSSTKLLDTTEDNLKLVSTSNEVCDPFEYFVDFDDPIGEPISDKDLYG